MNISSLFDNEFLIFNVEDDHNLHNFIYSMHWFYQLLGRRS
jgi:hypothetical protein